MSNDVCGYIEIPKFENTNALKKYIEGIEIGVQEIKPEELFNYPEKLKPSESSYIFLIGDRPGSKNATYLTDYYEYDPFTSTTGFPSNPTERLKILTNTLTEMFNISKTSKMVIAITDSNQVSKIKTIKIHNFERTILDDFSINDGPPDTIYIIER
ncbi:hypothetical protein NK553_28800 [Pseudomonas sp. ZM23]|uniref:Uncharacterized protein n=1 Tax=Pseudomonas triclosanedens TaxID=2961893 RepID=A0ABY6ZRH0_9PSED|nr:hypothetical protein [Pseudomonas triclosanedens]MCP8467944.1 hypothetical protein [Pseudomonas triclosanedens]MCP8473913.1 hypothetical protein [Pseudomonas triclosanedens]MCP8479915.1 hypothetical protein [Pseudomonas triclosanedens]WAI47137.1 hypothetical protein OU419_15260 [Pseudomonas triclosanedens]